MKLRVKAEKDGKSVLVRFWCNWTEFAYVVVGLSGLCAEVAFPSDWHEHRLVWFRFGFGLFKIAFALPWPWVVPDNYQCSGPTFGFLFFDDGLHLSWGKCNGRRDDPFKIVRMPWAWEHILHEILSDPEQHPYTYVLKSGEVQKRTATINLERRVWTRWWLPHTIERTYINVNFDNEVGERSGSWKGGTTGCSYDVKPGESSLSALRRMEAERKF